MEYDIETNKYGDKFYFKKGTELHHREDGPAMDCNNGDKEWWVDGLRHRTDGPAIEYSNGYKEWILNGQTHREDGPAVEYNGYKEWWIFGKQLSKEKTIILNKWWNNKNGK